MRPAHFTPAAGPIALQKFSKLFPSKYRARSIVCVHPGVGNPVRQWSPGSFAELVDLLVELQQVNVILVGSREEAAIAGAVMTRISNKAAVRSLVGTLSISELPTLIQSSTLFVGNNSGPQHLAAALGVPTVGIHSGVVDAFEWAPLGRAAVAVRRRMKCSPCYLERVAECQRGMACLTGLRPRDVYLACLRALLPTSGAVNSTADKEVRNDSRATADADTYIV